jgi:hypothetical protein
LTVGYSNSIIAIAMKWLLDLWDKFVAFITGKKKNDVSYVVISVVSIEEKEVK